MLDQHALENVADRQADPPVQRSSVKDTESHRLPNLEKLYHVPVSALRKLLECRVPGRKFGHLSQSDLVAEAAKLPAITAADIEDLYENYRYGQRLSFYLYLLPNGLASPDIKGIQSALEGLAATDHPDLADEVLAGEDFGIETSPEQIILLDEERLDTIREIRFRYFVGHRFLNADEEPDQVFQTRYGFLWLDLDLGYLFILTRDEWVNDLMIRALSNCLQAIPLPVHFPKELVDKHFSIEKVKRVSHYDPGTGMRQSISGEGLWKAFEQEIVSREKRFVRPSSLYEEEVADGITSGLGVASSKGKIYLTKALPASVVRIWGLQRLPDLVRDMRDLRATQPDSFDRSIEAINRMRLRSSGKAAIVAIVEALLQTDREELTSASLPQTALAIYDALAGKYFNPYLRTQCSQCEETAELCPHCESHSLDFGNQHVTCKECGATIADGEHVTLRCMNGHITTAPRDEVWNIAPNHWLQKRITRIFAEIGQSWSEKTDYFHIEGRILYRLRRGQVEKRQLSPEIQAYLDRYWDPASGQIYAASNLKRRPGVQERHKGGAMLKDYKSFDLRLRGNAAVGYTVEASVLGGGSVSPQPLNLPRDGAFQIQLDGVLHQSTSNEDMQGVGQALFSTLFSSQILKLWSRTVGSLGDETGLRIRLHVTPLELMALPWELMFEEEYVGLRLRFPVVRYLDLPAPPKPLAVRPPLRVLVAVSQPKDLRPFDVDSEVTNILQALGQLPDNIEVDVLDVSRRGELLDRLRRGYHVLHYVGHGTFEDDTGYLILEDPEGLSDPVSALLLGQMVADSNLRLAVLNACHTSSIGLKSAFGGVAHQLVKGGIPAVVAMQLAVADESASVFSRAFYGALADGWSVDAAVQEGRRGIMTWLGEGWSESVDWAIPTLYMRAPDGMILQIQDGNGRHVL